MVIPHREATYYPSGMYPSSEAPSEFFRNYGYGDKLPGPEEDELRRMRNRPRLGLNVYNVLLGILVIFILSISILLIAVSTTNINSTGFRSYDELYDVNNPLIAQSLDTGYFTITGLNVQYYDLGVWNNIASIDYSYDTTTGAITIPPTSITGTTTSIRVQADVTLSSPPTTSVMSILGFSLLAFGVISIIVMLFWNKDEIKI